MLDYAVDAGIASCRHIVGVPNAGEPFARAFLEAHEGESGETVLRLGKRVDGDVRRIEGVTGWYAAGDDVLLVDDLLTGADSKLEAVSALRAVGLKVPYILVIVDREQGGRDALEELGIAVHALYEMSELLELYVLHGRMTPDLAEEVSQYFAESQ